MVLSLPVNKEMSFISYFFAFDIFRDQFLFILSLLEFIIKHFNQYITGKLNISDNFTYA